MNKFIETIKTCPVSTVAIMVIDTELKMNKKGTTPETKGVANPYLGTRKVSKMRVRVNPEFEKTVNEKLEELDRKADFEAGARKWGTNIGNGIVDKEGELYVSFICETTESTEYFFEGKPVKKEDLAAYMPKPSTSSSPGSLVAFRTVAAANIQSLEIV